MRSLAGLIAFSGLFFSFNPGWKVYFIYIKQELDIAKTIRTVRVYGYTDTTMLYGLANSTDTLRIKSRRGKFLNLGKSGKINKENALNQELGGKWPAIGQNVLMVTDTADFAILFAFRVDNDYRFWDPNSIPFANAVFFIPKGKPFKKIPLCFQITDDKDDYWTCMDGCLVDAAAIKQRY